MNLSAIIKVDSANAVRQQFATEQDCEKFLHDVRWDGEITSPFDGKSKVYTCQGNRYRCKNTKKYFNVRTNTLFHNSKVALPIWFEAIWIIAHSNKISSVALATELKLTQKTAWYMLRRIKRFLSDNDLKPKAKVIPSSQVIPVSTPASNPELRDLTGWLNLLKNKQ